MALGSLDTMEIQLAKRKKKLSNGCGATKNIISWDFLFSFFSTEFSKCLIELTNLTYGFGIMQTYLSQIHPKKDHVFLSSVTGNQVHWGRVYKF